VHDANATPVQVSTLPPITPLVASRWSITVGPDTATLLERHVGEVDRQPVLAARSLPFT
jgi:hypothetical protein